jgi:hypothetical protein
MFDPFTKKSTNIHNTNWIDYEYITCHVLAVATGGGDRATIEKSFMIVTQDTDGASTSTFS